MIVVMVGFKLGEKNWVNLFLIWSWPVPYVPFMIGIRRRLLTRRGDFGDGMEK
jgi:hypothetical protein